MAATRHQLHPVRPRHRGHSPGAGPVPSGRSVRPPGPDSRERDRSRPDRRGARLRHAHPVRPAGAALPGQAPAVPADRPGVVHRLRVQSQSGARLAERRCRTLPPVHRLGPVVARHRHRPRVQYRHDLSRPGLDPRSCLPRRAGRDRRDSPHSPAGGGGARPGARRRRRRLRRAGRDQALADRVRRVATGHAATGHRGRADRSVAARLGARRRGSLRPAACRPGVRVHVLRRPVRARQSGRADQQRPGRHRRVRGGGPARGPGWRRVGRGRRGADRLPADLLPSAARGGRAACSAPISPGHGRARQAGRLLGAHPGAQPVRADRVRRRDHAAGHGRLADHRQPHGGARRGGARSASSSSRTSSAASPDCCFCWWPGDCAGAWTARISRRS